MSSSLQQDPELILVTSSTGVKVGMENYSTESSISTFFDGNYMSVDCNATKIFNFRPSSCQGAVVGIKTILYTDTQKSPDPAIA